jgi:hypothetical protein
MEQPELLGHLGSQLGRRLTAHHLRDPCRPVLVADRCFQHRLAHHFAAALTRAH